MQNYPAIVLQNNAECVADVFKQYLPKEKIVISKIDFQGARLVKNEEI